MTARITCDGVRPYLGGLRWTLAVDGRTVTADTTAAGRLLWLQPEHADADALGAWIEQRLAWHRVSAALRGAA